MATIAIAYVGHNTVDDDVAHAHDVPTALEPELTPIAKEVACVGASESI